MPTRFEWPTIGLVLLAHVVWAGTVYAAGVHGLWYLLPLAVLAAALHSSLQHECLHGHPTNDRYWNEACVFLSLGLFCPYRRFRTLHLKHHDNEALTDPYDDPETYYMTPKDWSKASWLWQRIRLVNNTQLGRLIIGPALSIWGFWTSELRLMLKGDTEVMSDWLLFLVGAVPVIWWVTWISGLNPLLYFLAVCYPTIAVLSIRTFMEHQARSEIDQRTIINEDRGLLSLIFLKNNLHLVHHTYPAVAWYKLPGMYRADRESYLTRNGNYRVASYWEVFRRYALRRKEPVEHPVMATGLWRGRSVELPDGWTAAPRPEADRSGPDLGRD
ncbi:MAG: fatty acid desaturase [Hyphomicrobiaceae bacterium]